MMPTDPSTDATPLPTREELDALQLRVAAFVDALDHAARAIDTRPALVGLVPDDELPALFGDARLADIETLLRTAMRALMVTSSLADLPDAARAHPAVQQRVASALEDMDAAFTGLSDALEALSPEERAAVSHALREEPDLAASVLALLDRDAEDAGVTPARREHLRAMGRHACFRLRQSTSGFIEEYADKIRRVRRLDDAVVARFTADVRGDAEADGARAWQLAVAARWDELLASDTSLGLSPAAGAPPDSPAGGNAYRPLPPPPPPSPPPRRGGTRTLYASGVLFGLGVFSGVTGGAMLQAESEDVRISGLFVLTGAAVFTVAGTICLLVGAILRWRDRRRFDRPDLAAEIVRNPEG